MQTGSPRSVFVKAAPLATVCCALLCAGTPSDAQKLQTLHVSSLTLSSDTAHPAVGLKFHLTISTEFKERVANPDELVILPPLDGLQIIGDERHATYANAGSRYTETLSVIAPAQGKVHVGAAHLDAIDARSGKPSRFSSNELTLSVGGNGDAVRNLSLVVFKIALTALTLFAATLALRILRKRRALLAPAPELPVAVHDEPANSANTSLADAVAGLKETRTRSAVLRVRAVLRQSVGAKDGETLGDILRGCAAGCETAHPVLAATERAAFIGEGHFEVAMDEMILSLERYKA